ncbi:hypothetical protein Tco_0550007, partial [Tanacetum coccineum]
MSSVLVWMGLERMFWILPLTLCTCVEVDPTSRM